MTSGEGPPQRYTDRQEPITGEGMGVIHSIYGEEAIFVDSIDNTTQTGLLVVTPELVKASRIPLGLTTITVVEPGETPSTIVSLVATPPHFAGHFREEVKLSLFPGNKIIKAAAESFGASIKGFNKVRFPLPVLPGQTMHFAVSDIVEFPYHRQGDVVVMVDGQETATIEKLMAGRRNGHEDTLAENVIIEGVAQTVIGLFSSQGMLPLFQGGGRTLFLRPVYAGDVLTFQPEITDRTKRGITFDAVVKRGVEDIAVLNDYKGTLAKLEVIKKIIGTSAN